MHWVDWAALGVIAVLGVRGYRQGVIVELGACVAIVLGILGGLHLNEAAQPLLPKTWPPGVQFGVGFALVFAAIALSVNVVARILRAAVHALFLGIVDRLLGAALGVLIGALVLFVLVLLVGRHFPGGGEYLSQTRLPGGLYSLADRLVPLLPEHFGQTFHQYYRQALEKLQALRPL
ncbi:MAG: CvpA family protein [Gemmatimonadota bacterium]